MRASLESGRIEIDRRLEDAVLALLAHRRRKTRGGSTAALLQPFTPVQCSWSGRSQLRTLTACEPLGPALRLSQRRIYSGLYMNELLMRLLQPEDPHRKLFDHYAAILSMLAEEEDEEIPLRRFELVLLEELGYGFDLASDGLSGDAVAEESWYHYHEEHGLVQASRDAHDRLPSYRGADLVSLARGDFSGTARQCAKRLMRQALSAHLGDRPLKSRDLFRRPD